MVRLVAQALKIATIAILALVVVYGGSQAFGYYRDQAAIDAKYGKRAVVTISSRDDTGEVAGVLIVFRRGINGFNAGETRLLEASADHIALALDNARLKLHELYEHVKEREVEE